MQQLEVVTLHSTCVTFAGNDNVYLAAVSVAITFVGMLRTPLFDCEHEGRNAEDRPHAVALWEGWHYHWSHLRTI